MGRASKEGAPCSVTFSPDSSAIGIINRSVLPLSRQTRGALGCALLASMPVTVTQSPFTRQSAPNARRQSTVANTSSHREIPKIWEVPVASPAEINKRCAMLLDGGAEICPRALLGKTVTCMKTPVLLSPTQTYHAPTRHQPPPDIRAFRVR